MDPTQNPQGSQQTTPPLQPTPVQQPTNQISPAQTTSSSAESFAYTPSQKQGKKKSLKKLLIGFIAAILVFLFVLTPVLFAYGYIPAGKSLQNGFENVIIGLPFMPKTPRYVLRTSAKALEKINTYTFDALSSVALSNTQSYQYQKMFSLGRFEIKSSGSVDKTDINNIKLSQTVSIGGDSSVSLIMNENKIYIKINSISSSFSKLTTMYTMYGISNSIIKELKDKWLFFDLSSLSTQGGSTPPAQVIRELFDVNKNIQVLNTILENPQTSKSFTLSSDTIENQPAYKITFKPDKQTMSILLGQYKSLLGNSIDTSKLGDVYEDVLSNSWIDKKDYLVRKTALTITYNPTAILPPSYQSMSINKIPISIVNSFSDFNKPVSITPPANAEKFQDFLQRAMTSTASKSAGFVEKQVMPNDKRQSNVLGILHAVYAYAFNKGSFPPVITNNEQHISSTGSDLCKYLVTTELMRALPADPSIKNNTPINDCTSPYDTGYTIVKSKDNRITVSAPLAENGLKISVTQ